MHPADSNLPAQLQHATRVLSDAIRAIRQDKCKRRAAIAQSCVFAILFCAVLLLETTMAAMMFSLLEVEVLGKIISGAAFGLLVPVVLFAAHVQKHHDKDRLTRIWLNRFASIGILLFVVGVSSMVGFSAYEAAQAALSDTATGPTGMIGGQSVFDAPVTGAEETSTLAQIPQGLLFSGLSFGMIISLYFASFCLGRVLSTFSFLSKPGLAARGAIKKIKDIQAQIKTLHHLHQQDMAARRRLPKSLKERFARAAGQLCQAVVNAKLKLARRKFDPLIGQGPLAQVTNQSGADALPAHITSEEEFAQHMATQITTTRADHILRVLNTTHA